MSKKKKKIVRPRYVYKKPEPKPLSRQTKIGIIVGVCVLALAVLLFALFYDDGSLPVKKGAIEGAQENWLIANLSSGRREKCYKLAEVDPLDGFALSPEDSMKSEDDLTTDFYMKPVDEDSEIDYYYITGVSSKADEMAASVLNTYKTMSEECSDIQTLTRADGTEIQYFIAKITAESGLSQSDSQIVCAYVPSQKDSSILITFNRTLSEEKPELSDEALVDWMEKISETITLEPQQ